MNVLFLEQMNDLEKAKIKKTIRRETKRIRGFKEREPFMLKSENTIVGSRIENNVIIEKIVTVMI